MLTTLNKKRICTSYKVTKKNVKKSCKSNKHASLVGPIRDILEETE